MTDSIANRQTTPRGASISAQVKTKDVAASGMIVAASGAEVVLIAAGVGAVAVTAVVVWDWYKKREHERRMAQIAAWTEAQRLPQPSIYGFLPGQF